MKWSVWLLCVLSCLCSCGAQGQSIISLPDTEITTTEAPGTFVQVQVQKVGTTTQDVSVSIVIVGGSEDFVGSSQILQFSAGGPETQTATFAVNDDDIPEPDEVFTFTLSLVGSSNQVTIGNQNSGTITILANDDAFGIVGFSMAESLTVPELSNGDNPVVFTLMRARGTSDTVYAAFQITGPSPLTDWSQYSGNVSLPPGQDLVDFTVQVLADNLPEEEEVFQVELTDVTGGANINQSASMVQVTIPANDSPVRFRHTTYYVNETAGSVTLAVTRGLDENDIRAGPDSDTVVVRYSAVSGTAQLGEDFNISDTPTISFGASVYENEFSIPIIDDGIPEIDENFTISLAIASGDAVLATPNVATVVIVANDDHNGRLSLDRARRVVAEDGTGEFVAFTVTREAGTYGVVSVMWELRRDDANTDPVANDIGPINGTVDLQDGERSQDILLTMVDDNIPEEAETYTLTLLPTSVTGGATVEGPSEGQLILRDSDDVYGRLNFASAGQQEIVTNGDVRSLQLVILREGGTVGTVTVSYVAQYHSPEGQVQTGILNSTAGSLTYRPGESQQQLELQVNRDAFLQVGGSFQVFLQGPDVDITPAVAASSPRLGDRANLTLAVTDDIANGEVGFTDVTERRVQEPDGPDSQIIVLTVEREGTLGTATVFWGMEPAADISSDARPLSGDLLFLEGESLKNISIEILPDDIAETDETFTVELQSVVPSSTQKLKPGFETVNVVIEENDDAGGIFSFSDSTVGPFVVQEGELILSTIIRDGGALVPRTVQYTIEPNGEANFLGGVGVARFEVGETSHTVRIQALQDGVPELNETYTLELRSFSGQDQAASVIGSPSTISISVLENDDPYGVFSFADTDVTISESTSSNVYPASLRVDRNRGVFGPARVSWYISPNNTADLSPVAGVLQFADGEGHKMLELQSLPDMIPEDDESFTIILTEPTNGASLGAPSTSTVTVAHNDDAVYFSDPEVYINEPGSATLTVRRNGSANYVSSVQYRTVEDTANEFDFQFTNGTITFAVGEREKQLVVTSLDDNRPETNEMFRVELFAATGDTVVYGNTEARVYIRASDDPNGVFSFAPAELDQVAPGEGVVVNFTVVRERGFWGEVQIWYQFYDMSGSPVPVGEEFNNTSGYITFAEGEIEQPISALVMADNIPEFPKNYTLRLVNATGGSPGPGGRLATENLEAVLTIPTNDDPYGRFMFPDDSRMVDIAEDFLPGNVDSTGANFTIQRAQGAVGDVELVWEILPPSLAAALPKVYDLFMLGTYTAAVQQRPGRDKTGTLALYFTGSDGSYLQVSNEYHPTRAEIRSGFTMSTWVQPDPDTDGMVISKTSPDGEKHYYSLKLRTTVNDTALWFRYSVPGNPENQVLSYSTNQVTQDGRWHHMAVTVGNGMVDFYIDGLQTGGTASLHLNSSSPSIGLGSTTLPQALEGGVQTIDDEAGALFVGAVSPGSGNFTGSMQDVRIYARKLTSREISSLADSEAAQSLGPVSGYFSYPEGERLQSARLQSVQDDIPEQNEVFTMVIISGKGGANVSPVYGYATVTVLKSDNANGLFGFYGPCTPNPTSEGTNVSCPVTRSRGTFDSVTVSWVIRQVSPMVSTDVQDFVYSNNSIVFPMDVTEMNIVVEVYDEMIPELDEGFEVVLSGVESGDGVEGTTPTSGASISAVAAVNNITVVENDYPYGLFQFSLSSQPASGDPVIPPATRNLTQYVAEESGSVTLLVVRAQGSVGDVSVEYNAISNTASTSADFQNAVGELQFRDQERFKTIQIGIVDDNIAELDEIFTVELTNPTGGGAVLDTGRFMTVVIEASDGAYGTVQFADNSLVVTANEADGRDSVVSLEVVRTGDALGGVTVFWEVESYPGMDLADNNGIVYIPPGQMSAVFNLTINSDDDPELDEEFVVRLVNFSAGRPGDVNKQSAVVTILANDDPYGVFLFDSTSQPVYVEEGNTTITLMVVRDGGQMGDVRVFYRTLRNGDNPPGLPVVTGRATESEDFQYQESYVDFPAGTNSTEVHINIYDDTIPEGDESVFVQLLRAELTSGGQQRPVPGSPRVGVLGEAIGEVIIQQNDNANGILQLSATSVMVNEDVTGPFLNVTRTAGAFGRVSVRFRTTPGTARPDDYNIIASDIILSDGEVTKMVPIEIVDDLDPELQEMFTVELLSTGLTGGAVLGNITQTLVTIDKSDDPHGVFSFEVNSHTVAEPESGTTSLRLTVLRSGGAMGTVTVDWTGTINGIAASADIQPVTGVLNFVSNDREESFMVEILSDNVPEDDEVVEITLVKATVTTEQDQEANIDPSQGVSRITIPANDNPHGVVQFASSGYRVQESLVGENTALIRVNRSFGTFGDLSLYYSTGMTDLIELAGQMGRTVMSYFSSAVQGSITNAPTTFVDVSGESNPLEACARVCLLERACSSFQYSSADRNCSWMVAVDGSQVDTTVTGTDYYQKDTVDANELYASQAQPGVDFVSHQSDVITFPGGLPFFDIPIQIINDTVPELDESFLVQLLRVELAGGASAVPENNPRLGDVTVTTVTIETNDAANGMFAIYSSRLGQGAQSIEVEETSQSVELVVERIGGTIGEVRVNWAVTGGTANTDDYRSSGGAFTFLEGETKKYVVVGIVDDVIPEVTETIVIQLQNPLGGATIDPDQSSFTISILANDNVAGRVGFSTNSRSILGQEGQALQLEVVRNSAAGRVTVPWHIEERQRNIREQGFAEVNGTVVFEDGIFSENITLHVLDDQVPETSEEYQIVLSEPQTEGVTVGGSAVLDPVGSTAVISILASNEPHGVVGLASSSRLVSTSEGNKTIQLFLDRKFGAIGTIRVYYEIMNGSTVVLNSEVALATPMEDFTAEMGYVDMTDGMTSTTIGIDILEDDIPELVEVFLVNITEVQLIHPNTSTYPPQLDAGSTLATVSIDANDGTKGVMIFPSGSASIFVEERDQNLTLMVLRDRGTYGDVSVIYYPQNRQASLGDDYFLDTETLFYADGENLHNITVSIFDDDIPEGDEVFEVVLSLPSPGLELGQPSKAIITILANDDAQGIISFETSANVSLNEPTLESTANSVAELRIIRGPGTFGEVTVQYTVRHLDGSAGVMDLLPTDGFVRFLPMEDVAILEISAVMDNLPEFAEMFVVTLLDPSGGAKLSDMTTVYITVEANDYPYGRIDIYPSNLPNRTSVLEVEEDVGTVSLQVERSKGMLGTVSVRWQTRGVSAVSTAGSDTVLALAQTIEGRGIRDFHTFTFQGDTYFVVVSDDQKGALSSPVGSDGSSDETRFTLTTLYKWQGAFVPVQTIETDGGSSCTSFTMDGSTYLAVANYGSAGRFQAMSRIYRVTSNGTLLVVQNMNTLGARNIAYFSSAGAHYLVVANYMDNAQQTNINSQVLQWRAGQFVGVQGIPTFGASALEIFQIGNQQYLAIANHYDSSQQNFQITSAIYRWEGSGFDTSNPQTINTLGATDVESFQINSDTYVVFTNSRDNSGTTTVTSIVYKFDSQSSRFLVHQNIDTNNARTAQVYAAPSGLEHLVIANTDSASEVLVWNSIDNLFTKLLDGPSCYSLYPAIVPTYNGGSTSLLACANYGDGSMSLTSSVFEVTTTGDGSDFIARSGELTFEPDMRTLTVIVPIVNDEIPESDESFTVTLSDPTGGAEIGSYGEVTVTILSNDNAHGIIGFVEDQLQTEAEETVSDNTVSLTVERLQGTVGQVIVNWEASRDAAADISPVSGQVVFLDGERYSVLTLSILADSLPELAETYIITLTNITESGSQRPDRGSQLNPQRSSVLLTILPNDSPHGVVGWTSDSLRVIVPETERQSTVTLTIGREQGTLGDLQISYSTASASGLNLPVSNLATPGQDYVYKSGSVIMRENITQATVTVDILPDNAPEGDETFLMNITSVQLLGSSPFNYGPGIRRPGLEFAEIIIDENDDAQGYLQFNVTKNADGHVETYEGAGTASMLRLEVIRVVGMFGPVSVDWVASPGTARLNEDYRPASGTVSFPDLSTSQYIDIVIVDDDIPEFPETFSVQLRNPTGGAQLGVEISVTAVILQNDSPYGLFQFPDTDLAKSVSESQSNDDPAGVVVFTVERVQGLLGTVQVDWRLESAAQYDLTPMFGSLTFSPGQMTSTITLRTYPDDILEGEERFTLSLTNANNGAEVSPVRGSATVIIQPNTGAAGNVSIVPVSRNVFVGEPDDNYDGSASISLTRGVGIYGTVQVTWLLTPSEADTFQQTSGLVVFQDRQQNVTFDIQTRDDNVPEVSKRYTLQLAGVTGGAQINQASDTATVTVVASDYPYGRFEFQHERVTVSEDLQEVVILVLRRDGPLGQVRITYSTTPGTATPGLDYRTRNGELIFNDQEEFKSITVQIQPDALPEGPETFYVNLTSVQLLAPMNPDFSIQEGGLQLDLPPIIGSVSIVEVTILKNDNAEGVIQFAAEALDFAVQEDVHTARVPVVRNFGTFGQVTAKYTSRNIGATPGADYDVLGSEVVFMDGQDRANIEVRIYDDLIREYDEKFELTITEATGGAQLGTALTSQVTISRSDSPSGLVGFVGETDIIMDNPSRQETLTFSIERSEGLLGSIQVKWRILGPNSDTPVQVTNDLMLTDNPTAQVLEGMFNFNANEGGPSSRKTFQITVQPYPGPEVQEVFNIVIYEVVGGADIDQAKDNVTLTIRKHGDPNGVVEFVDVDDQQYTEPTTDAGRSITLPIMRTLGTMGDIQVMWEVRQQTGGGGSMPASADVSPSSGVASFSDGVATSAVTFTLLPDNVPELQETFFVALVGVQGGAEIANNKNTTRFFVSANDDPHGVFAVFEEYQTVIVTTAQSRAVRVNVTRQQGTSGTIRVDFDISYSQAAVGRSYTTVPSGSVRFGDGDTYAIEDVPVTEGVFLPVGSTFVVTLTDVVPQGTLESGLLPRIDPDHRTAMAVVPQAAGNSHIGFESLVVNVNEATLQAELTVTRVGAFKQVTVHWQAESQENLPEGFVPGIISPVESTLTMPNGVSTRSFIVQLSPSPGTRELFAVRLTAVTPAGGEALLTDGRLVAEIEPNGVIQFAVDSRDVTVTENQQQVSLTVERQLGVLNNTRIIYMTSSGTAVAGQDFEPVTSGSIILESGERTVQILVPLLQDSLNIPELDEVFYVNITSVEVLPSTRETGVSPRLNPEFSVAKITIQQNDNPHGVFSFTQTEVMTTEDSTDGTGTKIIYITVMRTGGTFGAVSVSVRSTGGGEVWAQNPDAPGLQAAMAADMRDRVTVGQDYSSALDVTLSFQEGERESTVPFSITDDSLPEPTEVLFLYLTNPTGGARVANPNADNGEQGYLTVVIAGNDGQNGEIGFITRSLYEEVYEDDTGSVDLVIDRGSNFFEDVRVYWRATFDKSSVMLIKDGVSLLSELEAVQGDVLCVAGMATCTITVQLVNDLKPEFPVMFYVQLYQVGPGAQINPAASFAEVTMENSDYPYGLLQFSLESRSVVLNAASRIVRLMVSREFGLTEHATVKYRTQQSGTQTVAGVTMYPAVEGKDYERAEGQLEFVAGRSGASLEITLTPDTASSEFYPKRFQVQLYDADPQEATISTQYGIADVTIAVDETTEDLWEIWAEALTDRSDRSIDQILERLVTASDPELTQEQLGVSLNTMEQIIQEGESRELSSGSKTIMYEFFCKLLDSERMDTRGCSKCNELLKRFALMLLTGVSCNQVQPTSLILDSCPNLVVSPIRQVPNRINGYTYEGKRGDYFKLPDSLLSSPGTPNVTCQDLYFIEYTSQQWFSPVDSPVVGQKIISVSMRDREFTNLNPDDPVKYLIHTIDQRITPEGASCVTWNPTSSTWQTTGCRVLNDQSNYVECACTHMSDYAAQAKTDNLAGYTNYVYAACFITIIGMALTILAHHLCNMYSMFSYKLHMHLAFACMATQIAFTVGAYISSTLDQGSCAALGIVLHYFFLAQFTWMFIQAINFYRILVMNDEHTENKYMLFFVLGWGLPVLVVGVFIIVVFAVWQWDITTLYGDVHGNGDMCLIPNGYAALAGVVGPALLCLVVVIGVCFQAYQVTQQWKMYDDIYRGRYNANEVPLILFMYLFVVLTWVFGGLHLAYGYLWLLVIFCIFNVLQGVYMLVVYVLLRNQLCWPVKASYELQTPAENGVMPQIVYSHDGSLAGSTMKLVGQDDIGESSDWGHDGVGSLTPSNLKKYSPATPGNIYITTPTRSPVDEEELQEEQEFDDLIFALKTGAPFDSSGEEERPQSRNQSQLTNDLDYSGDSNEHYEMRRINIADTHL
ncbi:adhesion G-protein coupled receptor V1-like [Branchiostoma floridae]|uniref:Adhesion G-protein coupled receptor V1-like n=1 Tax=Branchiostoma floridae TaxID=7739 RepID=A0A9J7KJ45_BRAFL|nr:adhesion G-protein coupled receptor V1-like [Branchiostoma floridae]